MDVLYERCCGLDIHEKTVVACRAVPGPNGKPVKRVRRFGAMTDDVLQLADWLLAALAGGETDAAALRPLHFGQTLPSHQGFTRCV